MIKVIFSFPITLAQNISNSVAKLFNLLMLKNKRTIESSFLTSKGLINATIVALAIFVFLFLVQPYGIINYNGINKEILIGLASLAAFTGIIIAEFGLPKIFSVYFNKDKWTVFNETTLFTLRIFFAGLLVMITGNQTGLASFDLPLELLKITLVGTLISMFYNFLRETFLRNKHIRMAENFNESINNMPLIGKKDQIFPVLVFSGSNDKISIVPNQLIKVKISKFSSDFIYQNLFGRVEKTLNIGKAEVVKELHQHPQFVKIAKNDFTNINALIKVQGDASGFKAKISKVDDVLRVDKRFFKQLDKL